MLRMYPLAHILGLQRLLVATFTVDRQLVLSQPARDLVNGGARRKPMLGAAATGLSTTTDLPFFGLASAYRAASNTARNEQRGPY
jgi:hypothetical protein